MKKIIISILFLSILSNCSFDKKTGIWKDGYKLKVVDRKTDKVLDSVFKEKQFLLEEIEPKKNYTFNNSTKNKIFNWNETFQNNQNNIENINYTNRKEVLFKSKKLSGKILNNEFLYENENIIYTDRKGNVYVYSINNNAEIFQYNFYKKKYKKINKILNIVVKSNIIFVADNLGFVYALNYETNKIIWAKKIGIPIKSNLKIFEDQLFIATDTNKVFSLNIYDGSTIWDFFSATADIQQQDKNNFAIDKFGNLIFFNTNNSLYVWNLSENRISWITDLKVFSIDKNKITKFEPVTINNEKLLITSNKNLYLFDIVTGQYIWNKKISTSLKPVISNNNIFIVTDENYIVNINLADGEIIWSQKISNLLLKSNYKKINKKIDKFNSFFLSNNSILLFSTNHLIELDISKEINIIKVNKIPKVSSGTQPIFIAGQMFIFSNKTLYKFN